MPVSKDPFPVCLEQERTVLGPRDPILAQRGQHPQTQSWHARVRKRWCKAPETMQGPGGGGTRHSEPSPGTQKVALDPQDPTLVHGKRKETVPPGPKDREGEVPSPQGPILAADRLHTTHLGCRAKKLSTTAYNTLPHPYIPGPRDLRHQGTAPVPLGSQCHLDTSPYPSYI